MGPHCTTTRLVEPFLSIPDLPRITLSKWKELEVVPEWVKQDLVLVAVRYYRVGLNNNPHLLLHTRGEQGPRTYIMGTSPDFGLSKLC